MAPVVKALEARSGESERVICVTAQHREMLDQVLDWFDITPDIDLNLMRPDQTLVDLTARALTEVTRVLAEVQPDVVLAQGDTTTVMVTALGAFYQRIPFGHVEAGLRTHNLHNPFPEEANRHIAGVLASHHFAPTQTAVEALRREGVSNDTIHMTGNTVIDALQWTVSKDHPLDLDLPLDDGKRLVLITAHRRESFGTEFEHLCHALRLIAEQNEDVRLVYPVHLNPNVQEPVKRILSGVKRVHLIEPLAYPDFAHLMNKSTLILTDSGGIQEEAPSLGKPVLVMRQTTERPEAVDAGTAKLVGTDTKTIVREAEKLLRDPAAYDTMANAVSPFGDGHAAERIVDILLRQPG